MEALIDRFSLKGMSYPICESYIYTYLSTGLDQNYLMGLIISPNIALLSSCLFISSLYNFEHNKYTPLLTETILSRLYLRTNSVSDPLCVSTPRTTKSSISTPRSTKSRIQESERKLLDRRLETFYSNSFFVRTFCKCIGLSHCKYIQDMNFNLC